MDGWYVSLSRIPAAGMGGCTLKVITFAANYLTPAPHLTKKVSAFVKWLKQTTPVREGPVSTPLGVLKRACSLIFDGCHD